MAGPNLFSKYSFLDPALMMREINTRAGQTVVDNWGLLDQAKMEAEIETIPGADGTFDQIPINDPKWTPDSLETALFPIT